MTVTGPNTNEEESIHGQHIPLIIGQRDDIYTLGEPIDMRVITKNRTRETWLVEDPVYTACGPKLCMGTVVCDLFKSQMQNFDGPPTILQTEHRT